MHITPTTLDGDFTLFSGEARLQGPASVTVAATNIAPAAPAAIAGANVANPTIVELLQALLNQGFA